MIAIHYEGKRSTAKVVCDVCHQRIDDGSLGMAVFRVGTLGEREPLSAMHAHKGACQAAAEAKLRGKEQAVCEELVKHLQGQ